MTEHDEGRWSISLEVEVPATPQEVREAIATGPGISAWFVPSEDPVAKFEFMRRW